MIAYGYDNNGFFTGEVNMQKNPRNDGFLLPSRSTLIPIPENMRIDQETKFNLDTQEWEIVPNNKYIEEKLSEKNDKGISRYKLDVNGYAVEKTEEEYLNETVAAEKLLNLYDSALRGELISNLAKQILYVVIDHNYVNKFNAQQIDALQASFAPIENLLRADRPFHAKPLTEAVS